MVWLDILHPIQRLWLMGSPWFCYSFPRFCSHPWSRWAWARKKADTLLPGHLVSRVVGMGEALATDKKHWNAPWKNHVGAVNAFAMDNLTACKSQKALRQAYLGCPGQPRVSLLG